MLTENNVLAADRCILTKKRGYKATGGVINHPRNNTTKTGNNAQIRKAQGQSGHVCDQ